MSKRKNKLPNKRTLETIEATEKEVGLHNYNSIEELIDDTKNKHKNYAYEGKVTDDFKKHVDNFMRDHACVLDKLAK